MPNEDKPVNIDTVKPTEADKEWARYFLYPKPKSDEPFLLMYNKKGYKHALELVAAARTATKAEYEIKMKNMSQTRININGETRTATKAEESAIDEVFKQVEGVFGSIRSLFKKL